MCPPSPSAGACDTAVGRAIPARGPTTNAGLHAGEGAPVSDKVVAGLHEPTPSVGDGGPDMIQLLTPEGQRVSHPDYDKYVADL